MVTVRYTETYDLSTQIDKMGLIGIHTPGLNQLQALYPGLLINHRFLRVDKCDIVCACASVLPADPMQVGTESGEIAPQDMFNPILYKAVSNDSFNTITNRIYGLPLLTNNFSDIVKSDDPFPGDQNVTDDFDRYYAVLASQEGWKKAMPQQGFRMDGLYPIVYHMLATYGNVGTGTVVTGTPTVPDDAGTNESGSVTATQQYFRGNACRMPRIPLHVKGPKSAGLLGLKSWGSGTTKYCQPILGETGPTIPVTYIACILTPPAKLHKLYYRMRVTWTFTFEEVIPVTEYARLDDIADRAKYFYASDYAEQSKMMDKTESTVDVKDIDMSLVMTAGK